MPNTNFRNLEISTLKRNEVLNRLSGKISDSLLKGKCIHLVNAYTCTLFAEKTENNPLIMGNAINLIDGFWLEKYLNIKGKSIGFEQIRGPGLFESVLAMQESGKLRHLFIGSTFEVQAKLQEKVMKINPYLKQMNFMSPPFEDFTEEYIDRIVRESVNYKPDIVWVGMGTPKQDFLGEKISANLGVTSVCVGAAFDFLAGTVSEAPRFIQVMGLEWLFRLFQEPKRLWRRYLLGNFSFARICVKDWMSK